MEVILTFTLKEKEIKLSLIHRDEDKVWVGIVIDFDIRTLESVVCFAKVHVYHYFAYGCQRIAYDEIIYKLAIKYIKDNNLLAEL